MAGTLAAFAAIAGQGGITRHGVAAGFAMTALAMFGFVVNDIFDYRKDSAAGLRRPVASETFTRKSAAWLAAAILIAALLFSSLAGAGRMTLILTGAMLVLYSPLELRYPLAKDLYVAVLCCAPLYYGTAVGGRQYYWPSYAVLACFILGREILMDSDELPGDSKAGVRTIAAVLGRVSTARIGAMLMLVAAAALKLAVRGRIESLASVATLISLTCVFAWPGLDQSRRIHLSRLPMLLGSVALACGGI